MAAILASTALSLEPLLEAADHLSPDQRGVNERRFAARRTKNENERYDEVTLGRAARGRLSITAERRLTRLIAKSERGELVQDELVEYQALAQEAQRIDVARTEALAELVQRSGKSTRVVRT